MIIELLVSLCVAGLGFEEQRLPGLRIGSPSPPAGEATQNFLHVDLNGDELPDLLLAEGAYLQRGGRYPEDLFVAFPPWEGPAQVDATNELVHVKLPEKLLVLALETGAWRERYSVELKWPDPSTPTATARPQVKLAR